MRVQLPDVTHFADNAECIDNSDTNFYGRTLSDDVWPDMKYWFNYLSESLVFKR